MEHTIPELLTREDMLRILQNQRQLQISASELSDEELVRIFKSFAVPLAKRERKTVKHCSSQKQQTTSVLMDIDDPMETDMPIKLAYLNYLIEKNTIASTEKRTLDYEDDDCLSSATKRIKITWP